MQSNTGRCWHPPYLEHEKHCSQGGRDRLEVRGCVGVGGGGISRGRVGWGGVGGWGWEVGGCQQNQLGGASQQLLNADKQVAHFR